MTMDSEAATEGSRVTITCNYEQFAYSGEPKIEWFKDDQAFTPDQAAGISQGDNCATTERNRYIISSATIGHTGKYKCKATYEFNSKSTPVEPAKQMSFFVRKLSTPVTKDKTYHVDVGSDIDIKCTMNGDEPNDFKWYLGSGDPLPAGITTTPSSFKDNTKTLTMKITSAVEATHQNSFKCHASWSSPFYPKSLDYTVHLKVYGKLIIL